MGRSDQDLKEAKIAFKKAQREGDRAQEAQWANSIADMLKNRGEYVEALRWLRIDYEISVKFLPQKQLLPTCQSLGEIYLRLERFEDALVYQKKHLELAKDSNELVEQQRANTQLGRTYHEMFLKSEIDHTALRNAKKYLKSAMKLATTLKENPPCNKSSYLVKEFIDAHNNIGLLELDLDNLDDSEKILIQGLKICDHEEISEYDDARTRLHNSLGRVYLELREWGKARHHIERDILICKQIGHSLGESKGYINLGEVHFRLQKYDDAYHCYRKALDIAENLEDEDALVKDINSNFRTAKAAAEVLKELIQHEQKLKKLMRRTSDARGTANERKCLLRQYACLDSLIEKCCTIFAWPKHLEFAKRKKKVASQLCDKERLSDSFLAIGESYQKLRNFGKSRKWYMKSWNMCRSIANLEGQAIAKINIGSVLDSSGDWAGALQAFEEGYRIAIQGKLLSVQKTALENMHYSQMIRFDNDEEARKLLLDIQNLEHLLNEKDVVKNTRDDYCSESETEGGSISDNMSNARQLPDVTSSATSQASSGDLHKSCRNLQPVLRKRVRVVISDDEADEHDETDQMRTHVHGSLIEDLYTKKEDGRQYKQGASELQDVSHPSARKHVDISNVPAEIEESSCSFKSKDPSASKSLASGSKLDSCDVSANLLNCLYDAVCNQTEDDNSHISCKIGHDLIHMGMNSFMDENNVDTESLKVEVACRYYLKLYAERRSKGLVPVIKHLKYWRKNLGSFEPIEETKDLLYGNIQVEAVMSGWVPKRLMDMYICCCEKLSETPNMKLLKKLYNLEVSEDEVIITDCGLQDTSISPFISALQAHKTVAVLDISHNFLGNETMEKLQQMFSSSIQKYGGLTLDMHCNQFGPTSLFQICECPVLFARLEVLNLSQNRLTDSCSSYLCTILENCKALYSLSIEQCSITSRTIQKIAEALHEDSVLSHLSIGNNNPISGIAMVNLLSKLASLKRFSELSVAGIRLNKAMVNGICKLSSTSTLSGLLLKQTYIGMDGAVMLTAALGSGPQELVKLDLSYCGLSSQRFSELCANISMISGLLVLNLGGNSIGSRACNSLRTVFLDQQCSLKTLILDNCGLGLAGIVQVIQALSGNESLEELHLAENADTAADTTLEYEPGSLICSGNMEVADSDDEETNGSFERSSHKNQFDGSRMIQELGVAIESLVHLRMLDLSRNGLSLEVIDVLYNSWSSSLARLKVSAYKHVAMDPGTIHFTVKGKRCGIKSCCERY